MKKFDFISPIFIFILSIFLIFSTLASTKSALINELDLDQDGKVSIKEAVSLPELLASFGKIDVDGDGHITMKELEQSKFKIILKKKSIEV